MKTLSIASIVLALFSLSYGQAASWESSDAAGLYLRDLDDHDLDIRDLDNEFELDIYERGFSDNGIEPQLHIRNQASRNKAIINNIVRTKQEMTFALQELGAKVEEASKKFPMTKDTGKAWQKLGVSSKAGKKTGKQTSPKSKKKTQDEKDDELMGTESFWTKRDINSDIARDTKAESTIRCALLLSSFKPRSQLDLQLSAAEQHLKWNQWQYMEWELLTMQAVQMSKLMSSCNASGIQDSNGRLGKVWMAFSSVVTGLAAGARQNQDFPDKKMQQLARDFAGYQSS